MRARDVQTFFADLSTGAHSPSLISQGRIGQLVIAKPIERKLYLKKPLVFLEFMQEDRG